jgi:hypothetical protein
MKALNKRIIIGCALFACLAGLFLRIASFSWNKTLNGDVNLFALTARELVLHGQLDYPMKYEFSDQVAYLTLQTPASQHPPLWPILAGVIAKIFSTLDTFFVLKILSEITGGMLIGVIAIIVKRSFTDREPSSIPYTTTLLIAVSLASLSAILIDFSANGSPYILMALWLILSSALLLRFDPQNIGHLIAAGVLCALGLLTHSALIFISLGFLYAIIWHRTSNEQQGSKVFILKSRWLQILVFLSVILTGLAPWFAWNLHQFGKVFYSYSGYYLLEQLGLLHSGIYGDIITSRLDMNLSMAQLIQRYFGLVVKSAYALSREFAFVVGPFGLILLVVGIFGGIKDNKEKLISLLLPTMLYLAAIIAWATYKFRFLTPLLPVFCILAALGFVYLNRQGKIGWWIAGLCLVGTFAWFIFPVLQGSETLYYNRDSRIHDALYAEMQPLASSLASRPEGIVLGYAQSLDGGIETVYWHRFPFVAGRGLGEMEIKKLAVDFHIRYIWVDSTTLPSVQEWFPAARQIEQSGEFTTLELPD